MTEAAIENLRKVLELEQAKGFADSAVVGGLDGYLWRFLKDSPSPLTGRLGSAIRALPGAGYASLDLAKRRRWIEDALASLADRSAGSQPAGKAGARMAASSSRPATSGVKGRARPATAGRAVKRVGQASLDSPLSVLRGVSRVTLTRFARLGVYTVRDLLFHLPHRYKDFVNIRPISELAVGEEQTVLATVWSAAETTIGRHRKGTEAIVGDETGTLRVIWWGQRYVARQLRPNARVALSGKVSVYRGQRQMESPEYEFLGSGDLIHTGRLVPVYPLTEGLSPRIVRSLVKDALDNFADSVPDPMPPELKERLRLWPVSYALRQIHYPDSLETAEMARRCLAFQELLVIQLGVLERRRAWQESGRAYPLALSRQALEGFLSSLPFTLTAAQRRVLSEVAADIGREVPMSRLLQGDVGSGKTVVATVGLLAAVASGCQAAMMAPTEILAEQHYRTICALLGDGRESVLGGGTFQPPYMDRPLRVALLIGSLRGNEKAAIQEAIAGGEVDIAIGTHALIQEEVAFPRLGLVVVDEQHRFGVMQRAALRAKGQSPHVLVMTATPIPRTLALTVYGDLDISLLDEMPPGRKVVKTIRALPHERDEVYGFVREEVAKGRQAYIICPLVEESEAIAAKAAVQEYEHLARHVFPDLRLGLVHGRLPSAEREAQMRAFRDGRLDILVSTAVVEVGIDVPNATIMLVEGADRFGLSQLHQFRGRVGRGEHQSYCILLAENPSEEAQERLSLMETIYDGFRLAEEDLRLRGPGEYFGTRQTGMPDLKVARLSDVDVIERARAEAARLLEMDPSLARPEHRLLERQVSHLWERVTAEVS
ncbi:MAG: ATP-dependent DNA helicase RecG [Dehalococcoidia bacterium]